MVEQFSDTMGRIFLGQLDAKFTFTSRIKEIIGICAGASSNWSSGEQDDGI